MKTTVVNIRTAEYDIYIGRANNRQGLLPSEWGNPHRINKWCDREQAIELHEDGLRLEFRRNPERMNSRLDELRGKRLGCWCFPHRCHGLVLARLADMTHEEREEWANASN